MKAVLMLLLCLASPLAASQSDVQCAAHLVWHEARGEPLRVQASVLQVVFNRMRAYGQDFCGVVMQKSQFGWYSKKKYKHAQSWNVSKEMLDNYHAAMASSSLVDGSYLYFNDRPLPFGKRKKLKLGNLYFS